MKLLRLLVSICIFNMLTLCQSTDARVIRLESYLTKRRSPVSNLASVFVEVADQHGLDWRLLPALAVVESGAGKQMRGNNLFGWQSGKRRFSRPEDAIQEVGAALAGSRTYKDQTFRGAMRKYNPANRRYAESVGKVMWSIESALPLPVMLVSPKNLAAIDQIP